ncbi:hypothetical protein [Nonomuraea sediminis]|uniref:hypothetical protein n=1 Tax=Nonomuraea sediminis TaxID=2835864 RepID=UPI001BDC6040|nr:hypothetical protein [Nonomuraea sediminis]
MRVIGRLKALALAVGLLAGAAACTTSASPATTPSTAGATPTPTPSPTAPPVTPVEAAKVFATFTASDNALRRAGNMQPALRMDMDNTRDAYAQLTAAAFASTGGHPPQYTWGPPTLYVPRFKPDEQALWFTALATRNGHPTLVTFAKSGDWRVSATEQLLPGQDPPQVQLDAEGYATALPPDDKSVTISPQFMGPLHATIAEAGATGVTEGLIEPGPLTTDIAAQIATSRADAKGSGYGYDSIFSQGDYPFYALRTRDGGALIQYALTRITSTIPRTKAAKDDGIPVPESARWAIKFRSVDNVLKLTETHLYAAVVPSAKAPAPARVLAHDGALTRVNGS